MPNQSNSNVVYSNIDLNKMTIESVKNYDAVFIMEDMLEEASQSEYEEVYKYSFIPFFFIGTKKSYIPFTDGDLLYKDAKELSDPSYITGIVYKLDGSMYIWKFEVGNPNGKDKFSLLADSLFETINDFRKNKEDALSYLNSGSKV